MSWLPDTGGTGPVSWLAKDTMPVIVRDLDDDAATIIMVDSNLQRESLLPSERAFAYKMKLEAMKHQAGRPSKNSVPGRGQMAKESRGFGAAGWFRPATRFTIYPPDGLIPRTAGHGG